MHHAWIELGVVELAFSTSSERPRYRWLSGTVPSTSPGRRYLPGPRATID